MITDQVVAIGSSPSTITMVDLASHKNDWRELDARYSQCRSRTRFERWVRGACNLLSSER